MQKVNFILLDAAKMEGNLYEAIQRNNDQASLYRGTSEEELADVAPYLFKLESGSDFEKWYKENGWGNGWGIPIYSTFKFEETYHHFRKFLLVKTEDGEQLYFRFYDPRVLRIFLPTCDEKQLKEFFGPVHHFICEDEDPEFALVFSFEKNVLKTERIPSTSLFETGEQKNQGRKFFV
ncbi:MAG: DUF4123 domain-containing protein [Ferruginibacter sp.]